jgi:dTDP-4-dehydrorhamnose reductase
MKVLVTGRAGQLAQSLAERGAASGDIDLLFAARPQSDLAHAGKIAAAIEEARPDVVINAAAFTEVDRAEDEPGIAFRINCEAAGEAARAAAAANCAIIQLSTDYVFDGAASLPYREDSQTGPLNVYGKSKLAGEDEVRAAGGQHMIVRTSWLYGPFGRNFVKTMMRLAAERDEVRVIDDQYGSPTDTLALADAILVAVANLDRWPAGGRTFHLAGGGVCSWADMARQVMSSLAAAGRKHATVLSIGTSDYPSRARRPAYSALDSSRFGETFGLVLPAWRESVDAVVQRLLSEPDFRQATGD